MDTLLWVLLGLAAYWFILLGLRANDLLPSYIGMQGPVLTLHTQTRKRSSSTVSHGRNGSGGRGGTSDSESRSS